MDQFIFHLVVVLVAALVAAEVSERIGLPTVVGEIIAGILIGPSVLNLVGSDEILRGIAEVGVVVLLLEVGLQMDMRELAAVGRSSLLVAITGVTLAPIAYVGLVYCGTWIVPLATSYIPHLPKGETVLFQTRRFRGLAARLIALEHLYHLEHHLYPAVPHHNWPELARRLDPILDALGVPIVRLVPERQKRCSMTRSPG